MKPIPLSTKVNGLRWPIKEFLPMVKMRQEVRKRAQHKHPRTEIALAKLPKEEVPPLLGRRHVFDRFHINFKQDRKLIEFTPANTNSTH